MPDSLCKSEEEVIEEILSLELVKCFSKVAVVRALKPITQAIEGEIMPYREHWLNLIRYEAFCKLTGLPSEMVPPYTSSVTVQEFEVPIEESKT